MTDEYHITSFAVHCQPGQVDEVCRAIESMAGAEIHARTDEGKLAVTLERRDRNDMRQGMEGIATLPGVLSAALTYHRVETLDELGETTG
ncbi:chaperone NapD [Ferrimonas balearica]|uniref:chaperone NapD n=1 Tax=Ferrimonas balearica TaxID=44012 RepID=UPI001C99CD56|nr:chaperone NapD [Ferrimonas balearica]MBY5993282.1 chaperone NapD [Ferrimonas balearica]